MNRARDNRLHQPQTILPSSGSNSAERQIVSAGATAAPPERVFGSRRRLPIAVETLGRLLVAGFFGLAALVMRGIVWVYFRRLVPQGLERFPRSRPVLLVANHPAAWTDAVVLDVVLGRKLHFITSERLFHPLMRSVLLRMFGSLPVRFGHNEDAALVNRMTFDRCHELLGRREVVAFFPEGVSGGDRTLLPLRPGAARLLIEQAVWEGEIPPMIPVALYYEDRTAFREDVLVVVGEPIPFLPVSAASVDMAEAAKNFTARISAALETTLAQARALRHARRDAASTSPARTWMDHPVITAAILLAGVPGVVLHVLPGLVIEGVVRNRGPMPQQVALGRISLGVIFIIPWYLTLALLATTVIGMPWYAVFAAPCFGIASCLAFDRWRASRKFTDELDRGDVT